MAKPNAANRILAKRKGIKRKVFSDTPSALFGLLSAQVDVVAYPEPVFKKLARDGGISDRFKVVGEPLIELKRGMAVRKGRTELLALLNRGVNDFIKSPEYRATYVRYFGKPPPFWTPERIALVMGLVLVGTAIIMAAWRYISMSQLNRKLTVTVQEREGIAEELRQSEHRFKDFADAASDWFWETDQNHKFTYVSQPYYDFTGFQPEERLGRTRQELVPPTDLKSDGDKWTKFEQDLKERRPFKDMKTMTVLPDGKELHVLNNGIPIFDDNKNWGCPR